MLYEFREADFHEINRADKLDTARSKVGDINKYLPETGHNVDLESKARDDGNSNDRSCWEKDRIAFMLKAKISSNPILKHFDPNRTPVIVKWAVSAALLQEHDGVHWPVTFTSRTLKPNELN